MEIKHTNGELTKIEAFSLSVALSNPNIRIKKLSIDQIDRLLLLKEQLTAAAVKLQEIEKAIAKEYNMTLQGEKYIPKDSKSEEAFKKKMDEIYASASGVTTAKIFDSVDEAFKEFIEDISLQSASIINKHLR